MFRVEQYDKKDTLLIFNNKVYSINFNLYNKNTEKKRSFVVGKKRWYQEFNVLEAKRKKQRFPIFLYSLTVSGGLLAIFGVTFLTFYSGPDLLLLILAEIVKQFAFFINSFLIMFTSLIGLFLSLSVRSFVSAKKKINRFQYSVPSLENAILQFLIDNKGNSFTSNTLIDQIKPQGTIEEFNAILNHLVENGKLDNPKKDTQKYSINLNLLI